MQKMKKYAGRNLRIPKKYSGRNLDQKSILERNLQSPNVNVYNNMYYHIIIKFN